MKQRYCASSPDFFIKLRRNTAIGKQFLIGNDRDSVRQVVLGLSQDGACTDLVENLSENSLKGDLSNATTFNRPLFSLVNTFKKTGWPNYQRAWKKEEEQRTCVEATLGSMVNSVDVLRVGFVLLANAAAGATGARHPRQAQGPARKVPAEYGEIVYRFPKVESRIRSLIVQEPKNEILTLPTLPHFLKKVIHF